MFARLIQLALAFFVRICLNRIIADFCWRRWHRHGEKRLSNRRDG